MEDHTPDDQEISKYHDRYEKGITELLEEKELKTKWHKEILENVSMQEHFKSFHPVSIDTFIMFYLSEKYLAYKYADSYERQVEEKRSRWIDAAHDHLKVIQQKKLFDLQCLWRAEEITLDGVEISFDFEIWKNNILNCPFLEPVSKDDIKMYQDFLLTADIDYDDIGEHYEMQEYTEFKANYTGNSEDGLSMPEWYDYHNLRTGNSSLLLLPDIRGEKELFYFQLFSKDKEKDLPPPAPYVPDERPSLNTHELEKVTFFVNTFEDDETRKKYANFSEINKKNKNNYFDLAELIMEMEEEDENIPIESYYDFREGLYNAYNTFKLRKLGEHMPLAHEQYLFNRKMGLSVEENEDNDFYIGLRDNQIEKLLKARELNGEERNLKF